MRPIDADAFFKNLTEYAAPEMVWDAGDVEHKLDEMPTLTIDDLRPKGEWVMKETMIRSPYAKNAYCSECLEETSFTHNYCPNCGAKMGGGE